MKEKGKSNNKLIFKTLKGWNLESLIPFSDFVRTHLEEHPVFTNLF